MSMFYFCYLIFLTFLSFNVLYLAIFTIAGRVGDSDDENSSPPFHIFKRIGVLIPAYKEDAVIVDSVMTNLKQTYPANKFDLIVIADSLQPHVLTKLATLPIKVIEVSFVVSTIAKAVSTALSQLPDDQYDLIVVSDADNHMASDFLARINTAFQQGWQAVQGHRVAKNTNTSVAILDAISEEINNHLFRKGSRALGLSASIIGSGMAIDYALMKASMDNMVTMGGYDKELEMKIVLSGHTIGYLKDAVIYDEKVENRVVFENQRTRWIAAQWQFLNRYFGKGVNALINGQMISAFMLIKALILPKVLLLGILLICTCAGLFSGNLIIWAVPLGLLLTLTFSLILSVPNYLWKRFTIRELLLIPILMLNFARAVLNMRKAFKSFMHTPHTTTSPNQVKD